MYTLVTADTLPILPIDADTSDYVTSKQADFGTYNEYTTVVIPVKAHYCTEVNHFKCNADSSSLRGLYFSSNLVGIDTTTGIPTSYDYGTAVSGSTITITNGIEYFTKNRQAYLYLVIGEYVGQISIGAYYSANSSYDYYWDTVGSNFPYTVYTDIYVDGVQYRPSDVKTWSSVYYDYEGHHPDIDITHRTYCGGQLMYFSGCAGTVGHFLGWWSNPNATGTRYSTSPRFLMEMPSSNLTMYACYSTTAVSFDWDAQKVSNGLWNVTAVEFNRMLDRVTSNALNNDVQSSACPYRPLVSDLNLRTFTFAQPIFVIQGLDFDDELTKKVIQFIDPVNYQSVIATYNVAEGNPIQAALFQWFKNTVNSNYR